jgi:hypothetical protein
MVYPLMVGGSCNALEESRNGNAMNTIRAKVRFFRNKKTQKVVRSDSCIYMRPGIHVKHQPTRQKVIFKKTDKGFWYSET